MKRMSAREALALVHAARRARDIVITTMTPARDWMTMPQSALDMVLVPSAMSHATSMGLGLALAQPERRVIVCNGDGSMLMNLGSLVSIAAAGIRNMTLMVFDNGTYEVTGSQPVPGGMDVDYCAIGRGAGFTDVREYSSLDLWREHAPDVLNERGLRFVLLHVEPVYGLPGPKSPGPAQERARTFMNALQA